MDAAREQLVDMSTSISLRSNFLALRNLRSVPACRDCLLERNSTICSGALLLFKLLSAGADRRRAAAWSPHRGRAAAENRQDKDRADSRQ